VPEPQQDSAVQPHGHETGADLKTEHDRNPAAHGGTTMDKHRKEGSKREMKGIVNEVVGDLTDNPSKERKGRSQQNLGEKQREYGEALDQARDVNATRH
jgi:uncharacterized protein YjbJ (UPF0337 family)